MGAEEENGRENRNDEEEEENERGGGPEEGELALCVTSSRFGWRFRARPDSEVQQSTALKEPQTRHTDDQSPTSAVITLE